VPIGARSAAWLEKYIREGRPQLVSEPDDFTVFLTANGEPFSRDHLTFAVRERISAAKLGKGGACHLFRPYDGNADARERRGHPPHPGHPWARGHQDHADLYAGGNPALQQIHAATHPAEAQGTIQAARTAAEREGLLRRWQPRPRKMKNWAAKRKTGMRVSL